MGTLTNLEDVKRSLAIASNVNGTLSFDKNLDDTLIQALIEEASDVFSEETGNNYYGTQGTLTLNATNQYIDGRRLYFKDDVFRSITRIENDVNGTFTSADWVTIPLNSSPYYGVELKTQYWQYNTSPLGAIRVIGALGENADGQPSNRVHLAVTRLASFLYQTRDTRGSVQIVDSSASTPDTIPDEVQRIIQLEKRNRPYS